MGKTKVIGGKTVANLPTRGPPPMPGDYDTRRHRRLHSLPRAED